MSIAAHNGASQAVRSMRATVRQDLNAGRTTFAVAVAHPALADTFLVDVVGWVNGWGPGRRSALNKAAVREGINLVVPCGRATPRTVRWLTAALENGLRKLTHADVPPDAAELLAQAIVRHRSRITGPDPDWGNADAELWAALSRASEEVAA